MNSTLSVALRISSLFTRLLTEAARTTPIGKSPQIFAWERLTIAVFENGLLPAIRLEQIREDPAHSFASARDRARKHASNNLHGVNVSNLSSVVSTSPALKTQLETRLDNVQATIASIIDAPTPPLKQHCGRSKSERQATQGRRDSSLSRGKTSGKQKTPRSTRPSSCMYEHCMRPNTHRTEDCLFKKLAEKIGSDPSQGPDRLVPARFGSITTVSRTALVATRHPICPVVAPVGTKGTNTVVVSAKADGRRTPSAVLTPKRLLGTRVRSSKHQLQQDLDETKYDDFFSSLLRHSQPAVLDVSSYSTRFPSTRVPIPGVLEEDNIEHQLTINSATDIPCISKTFIDKHEKLRQKCIFPVPPGAISLRSADGSPLKILGYIRFTLKLGNKSLPVEALVLPHLGPDVMLLDNSIMKSFGAKLNWTTECLSFQDSRHTIPAVHVRRSVQPQYCSVITQTADTQPTPVLVSRKYVVPAAHEALIRVFSTARPEKDTLALIEPGIASIHTLDDMPHDEIWQSVIIARTVTQWSSLTNSALVQVGNPSDRAIILKPNTIVGTISPVTAISPQTASAITQNCSESSQARIDLTAALDESFKNTTLTISSEHRL